MNGEYFWFREPPSGGVDMAYQCRSVLYSGRSRYQRIDIFETPMHGVVLFLDGVLQSAEKDEFIYHEVLVHPALWSVNDPRSVLIIGGGEGATLREVCRHDSVERIVMVEIDGELMDIARKHLPQWHQGAFDDARVELVVGDGRKYLEQSSERFDVVILDLSDPVEGSPAALLFTREFYAMVSRRLTPSGCCSVQGEAVSPQQCAAHARIVNTLKTVFPAVRPCRYFLHSFHRPDAHIVASLDPSWSPEKVARRAEKTPLDLRYLSPDVVLSSFSVPPYLQDAYRKYDQPLTDSDHRIDIDDVL